MQPKDAPGYEDMSSYDWTSCPASTPMISTPRYSPSVSRVSNDEYLHLPCADRPPLAFDTPKP